MGRLNTRGKRNNDDNSEVYENCDQDQESVSDISFELHPRHNKAKRLKKKRKQISKRKNNSSFIGWIRNIFVSKDGVNDGNTINLDEDRGGSYILSADDSISTQEISNSNSYDTEEDYLCRMQDFQYARQKRCEFYGDESPWGILGLYEHLAAIRTDIEWADDNANRKANNEKPLTWTEFENNKQDGLNRPFFTYLVVALSTVMMIVELYKNEWKIEEISVNPMIGPSSETLVKLGAKVTDKIVNDEEYYRIFTPMFLHAGLIHFFLNMFAVFAIGTAVEIAHGTLVSTIIFFSSSIGGTILSALFLPEFISVGASGGIFGYIGACLADIFLNYNLVFDKKYDINGTDYCRKISIVVFLISDMAINVLVGLTPFVDNFTHMGGFLYGILCGFAIIERISLKKQPRKENISAKRLRVARTILCCLSILVALKISSLYLLTGDGITSPCSICRYTSCVSFPPWNDENDKWWYCDNCGTTTANAQRSDDGYYELLLLNCPDDTQVGVDVSSYYTDSESEIQNMLPFLCRANCENTYF